MRQIVPRKAPSMGYVPLFDSLTTGTLHGKWPDIGLWPVMLSMADRFGNIDVTPQYIAGVTGLPESEVIACLVRFCSPDPDSRTSAHGGRRLEPLEDGRKWGWHVVNHTKYREKARLLARDSQRTASGMDAERKRKGRVCPPASPEVPPSDGNEDGDGNKTLRSSSSRPYRSSDSSLAANPKNDLQNREEENRRALKSRLGALAADFKRLS